MRPDNLDQEFFVRASELAAVVGWARGLTEPEDFRRRLRSVGWSAEDAEMLAEVVEQALARARLLESEPEAER